MTANAPHVGDPTELADGKTVHKVYCYPCVFLPWLFNAAARRKRFGGQQKIPAGTKCADCGRKATARDHRDYGELNKFDYVCHPCNHSRGPAAVFPEWSIALSRKIKRIPNVRYYQAIKKEFQATFNSIHGDLRKGRARINPLTPRSAEQWQIARSSRPKERLRRRSFMQVNASAQHLITTHHAV